MHIRILGCSGGIGPGLRTTSLLVDDHLLIDAGTGVGDLDSRALAAIRTVMLTHSHLDHICGLAFMADNLFGEIDHPLQVHAIPETLAVLREHIFNWKVWPDFTALPCPDQPLLLFNPVQPGEALAIDGLRLTPFKVCHSVPAVGYAVESDSGLFAFSGDTCAGDPLWDGLNALPRLDHLMIEVAFPNCEGKLADVARHFTPAVLGAELSRLRHRPMLHLTHAKPGCEARIAEECAAVLSGWRYRHLKTGDTITV